MRESTWGIKDCKSCFRALIQTLEVDVKWHWGGGVVNSGLEGVLVCALIDTCHIKCWSKALIGCERGGVSIAVGRQKLVGS